MKKIKNLKSRLLCLSLAFAMVLSLAMGMAPMNVHATEGDPAATTTLTYEVVGGTGSMSQQTLPVGENFALPNPSFTPVAGREFFGWVVYECGNDERLETSVYAGDVFQPKNSDCTYKAIAYYGYSLTVENLPENTEIICGSKAIGNPKAIVVPEFTEDMMEGNAFMIINESITSAPSFTEQNGTAVLIPDTEYMYCVQNITGPVTLTYNAVGGTETEKIGSLADKVSVVNNPSGDYTVSFNLDSNKSYVISTATAENFYRPELFDATYGPAKESVIGLANNVNVTPKSDLTHENLASHWSNPQTSDLNITGAKNGLVSSYEPITVNNGTYIVIYEVKPEDKIAYVDTDSLAPDYSGDYYIIYAAHAVFFPYGTGGNENPPTEHTHTWVEDSWGKDDYEHWKTCSGCSEVKDSAEHMWEQGVDENFHWGFCSVCGYEENKQEHYEANPTNNDYMCDYCKYALPCDSAWRVTIDSRNFDGNLEGYAKDINGNTIYFNRENHRFFIGEVSALNVLKGSDIDLITNAECTIAVEGSYGETNSFTGGGEDGESWVNQIIGINGDLTIVLNPQAPAPTPDSGNNGGSSSSSSSSSTPSTSTPAPAPITVPVSNGGNDNVVNINASVSGETAKVSELTAEEINKVANNETNTNSIEINLSETGKKIKEASLPVTSLNEIARIMDDPNNKLDNITIKLSTATVEVSEHTLKAVLSKTTGNDLRLVVDVVQKDTLNNTQKEAVKNQNVHQCIDAYFISNGVRIGDFQGGTATIRLPFNVPEGLNGNGFSVWYVGDDGRIEKHDTQYVNGELVFTVSHFSDYVVVYDDAVKDDVPKTGEAADYSTMLWTSILAIGVLGLVLNRQKRRQ